MRKSKLVSIQWQLIRNSISISILTGIFFVFILTFGQELGFALVFDKRIVGIPMLIILPIICILVGAIYGYVLGNKLKKRLDVLLHGTVQIERGNFSYRFPTLGEDEVGLISSQLNEMISRVEEQIGSLQRLSTERAEWQETIKQTAIGEERQRLARDLHDAVSQQLFAISMMTAALPHTLEKNKGKVFSQIEAIEKMAQTAQSEMRALLLHLRPAHLEGKNLKTGIEDLLQELKHKHRQSIEWKIEPLSNIPKGIEDHMFRLVQEAVSNILRHAKAERIELQLREMRGQLRLKIIDNGIGFDTATQKSSSYGLQMMKERVNEIGGVLEIISVPGKGTQVEAKVPLVHAVKEEKKHD
ncbi:sensor histidine kinase [Alkalihalobacterium bogoriense]|uniref:sensor histidine kinase n=1 Tax=Alkalihalobacterium bogoriense TaxID=246272 RepID=UPI000478846C|nr:sensor histidine kinase [Alkalihalobacterium bogoriense]